jgi:phosphoribosyl 1,2-cyclic phosphate phosphodiesterase
VPVRSSRRRFTSAYKIRILQEADKCGQQGHLAALLRREGLYSSALTNFRKQKAEGRLIDLNSEQAKTVRRDKAAEQMRSARRLEHLLVTHSHDDHWFPRDLAYRRKGFSVVPNRTLHVWGNEKVEQTFVAYNGPDWSVFKMEFHLVACFEPIDLGEGLTATPVLAAHDRDEECINYRLAFAGKTALLGHDTGWYSESTWEFLSGTPIDLLLFDCTHGVEDHVPNHLGGLALIRAREELARRGALAPSARCIATHFSHNGRVLHEEMERFFAPHGFEVAYDGMRLELG